MIDWSEFNKMGTEEWKTKVNLDLKGKKLASDFVYNVEGDFKIDPFITHHEITTSVSLSGNSTKSCIWINVIDSKSANQIALQYLNLGVESLIFEIQDSVDFELLFDGIYLDLITVFIAVHQKAIELKAEISSFKNKFYPSKTLNILVTNLNENNLKYDNSFKKRLETFNQLATATNLEEHLLVRVELKKDFLAQIAELRAMRMIWTYKGRQPEKLIILSCLNIQSIKDVEIHKLIISNYLLMSACIGMSDFAVGIADEHDRELARLCLNIQHILREESSLHLVSDPVSGSYLIESLTKEMVASII